MTKEDIIKAIELLEKQDKYLDMLTEAHNLIVKANMIFGPVSHLVAYKASHEVTAAMKVVSDIIWDNRFEHIKLLKEAKQYLTIEELL